MIAKPIFVIGNFRSGTTLLYETLCNHEDLSFISNKENYELWKRLVIKKYGRIGYLRMLMRYVTGNKKKSNPTRDNPEKPNEGNGLWSYHMIHYRYMTENDWTQEMQSFFDKQIERLSNQKRFINKNPLHSYRVRLLNRLYGDCKFIHIIRDREATIRSQIKFGTIDINKFDLLLKCALEASQFEGRYYEIRYEDLVSNPEERLIGLLRFCELPVTQNFLDRIPPMQNRN